MRTHTKPILQMEAAECGAAALAIILNYFGKTVPLEILRIQCGVSRDGSRATNIVEAAKHHNLDATAFKLSASQLPNLQLPAIIFWKNSHFMVLEGFKGKRIYLNDPAYGKRVETQNDFASYFSNIAIVFSPNKSFQKSNDAPPVKQLALNHLSQFKSTVISLLLVTFLITITTLVIPGFLRIFIDYILIGQLADWAHPLLWGILITLIIRTLLMNLQQSILFRFQVFYSVKETSKLLLNIIKLPISFFMQRSSSDISERIQIPDSLAENFTGPLIVSSFGMLYLFLYLLLMMQYDLMLTVLTASLTLINILVLQLVTEKKNRVSERLEREFINLKTATQQGIQGIESIKSSGSDYNFFARLSGFQAKIFNTKREIEVNLQILNTIPPFLTSCLTIAILSLGSFRIMQGHISLGMLVAFLSLVFSFLDPINQFMNYNYKSSEIGLELRKYNDILNYKPEMFHFSTYSIKNDSGDDFKTTRLKGCIEFKNVTFGYNPIETPLLNNISFKTNPGDRLAITGISGKGKTTITELASGLLTPWSGQILIDNIPITHIPKDILRHSLAYVGQELFFFEGTISQNLTLNNPTVPDSVIVKAAKDAFIHDQIISRPGGYESSVLEMGKNFSTGELQRLQLARALITKPAILILDEATNALDAEFEKQIEINLRHLNCTCLIVSTNHDMLKECNITYELK